MGSYLSTQETPKPLLSIRIGDVLFCPGSLNYIGKFEFQPKTFAECRDLVRNHVSYSDDQLTMEYIFIYSLAAALMFQNNIYNCSIRHEFNNQESIELHDIVIDPGYRISCNKKVITWCSIRLDTSDLLINFNRSDIPALIVSILDQKESNYTYMIIALLAWIYVNEKDDTITLTTF